MERKSFRKENGKISVVSVCMPTSGNIQVMKNAHFSECSESF